ncbi:MAG: transglutaminase domain-containing protein, partial [Clostridia bacterium]|nr:transglutaminase domain-containing protein [Clostridia bacterium]
EETLLSKIPEKYPLCTLETLRKLTEMNYADHIVKNGKVYYQRDAKRNLFGAGKIFLESLDEEGNILPYEPRPDKFRNEFFLSLKENGVRAYRFTVKVKVKIKEEFVRAGEEITVHIPYPAICDCQPYSELVESSHPVYISESEHRTACIKTVLKEDETFFVTFKFDRVVRYIDLDDEKVSKEQPSFYTGESLPHIRFTPYLVELANKIKGDETNPLKLARRVYAYITENINYSYLRDYLYIDQIPEYVLKNGKGDCGAQALTFITLCRILNVPAKWESGLRVGPDINSVHDWAQIYVAPYGWIPVDLTDGGGARRNLDDLKRKYSFGNIDPFRMTACNDFQMQFDPPKKFMRCDPYDNQLGEAEYNDFGLGFGTMIRGKEILDIEDVSELYRG